jgi:hypothetical protein
MHAVILSGELNVPAIGWRYQLRFSMLGNAPRSAAVVPVLREPGVTFPINEIITVLREIKVMQCTESCFHLVLTLRVGDLTTIVLLSSDVVTSMKNPYLEEHLQTLNYHFFPILDIVTGL